MPKNSSGRLFDSTTSKDRVGRLLNGRGLVPDRFKGTDRFLDVVSWNIRYFDHADPVRVDHITEVLSQLNADVLVLLEIAQDGALDEVVKRLADRRAGFYSVKYGTTGAQQRVVLMWDRDWVRAKKEPVELFGGEKGLLVEAEYGKGKQAAFPRLPLWGLFEATPASPGTDEGFTFELMGVHMKAQGPGPKGAPKKDRWGIPQRTVAAKRLAKWLTDDAAHLDPDVLVIGDWNAAVGEKEWAPLTALEAKKEVLFKSINKAGEPSHLVRLNKGGAGGSRIDLHLVTKEADAKAVPRNKGVVVQWSLFDDLEALDSRERQELFKGLKQRFSDHLPVVSRFYMTEG